MGLHKYPKGTSSKGSESLEVSLAPWPHFLFTKFLLLLYDFYGRSPLCFENENTKQASRKAAICWLMLQAVTHKMMYVPDKSSKQ